MPPGELQKTNVLFFMFCYSVFCFQKFGVVLYNWRFVHWFWWHFYFIRSVWGILSENTQDNATCSKVEKTLLTDMVVQANAVRLVRNVLTKDCK